MSSCILAEEGVPHSSQLCCFCHLPACGKEKKKSVLRQITLISFSYVSLHFFDIGGGDGAGKKKKTENVLTKPCIRFGPMLFQLKKSKKHIIPLPVAEHLYILLPPVYDIAVVRIISQE